MDVGIRELKNHLSHYLVLVVAGSRSALPSAVDPLPGSPRLAPSGGLTAS